MIFCDTSTAAKLYVPERESAEVRRRLESEDEACVSELMRPELMGVFHRRLREGRWTRGDFLAATRQFQRDDVGGFWTWLKLDGALLRSAAEAYSTLPPATFLRTSDCIHLVTALQHRFGEICTYDMHQARAAAAFGLKAVAA